MSLVQRLLDFVKDAAGPEIDPAQSLDVTDERLAAAALLVHVARVDGQFADGERRALLGLLEAGYGLSAAGADALMARADRFDREVDDVAALVEMLGHEDHGGDRKRLLGMAYGVATADGALVEFEDDLLWRMGGLLGFDDAEIGAIRAGSVRRDAGA